MLDKVDNKINISQNMKKRLTSHVLIVALISILLLIPQLFVDLLLSERSSLLYDVQRSITNSWGSSEKLTTPYLVVNIPKRHEQEMSDIDVQFISNKADVDIEFKTEKRSKGNYTATLYLALIKMNMSFDLKSLRNTKINNDTLANIINDSLLLTLSHSDNKFIDNVKYIKVNGEEFDVKGYTKNSFIVDVSKFLYTQDTLNIDMEFTVKGSQSFTYYPYTKQSILNLSGDYIPEFTGSFLPSTRSIAKDSFKASYENHQLATGILDYYVTNSMTKTNTESSIELNFNDSVNDYTLIDRLTKYAILFISITFTIILCFEIIKNIILSPLQFCIIGISLIVFYLVLLSLSEYISVTISYIIAALIMTTMISFYIKAIFHDKKIFISIVTTLVSLYSVLYAIVHAERYALLLGTTLILIILAFIMYITKNLSEKVD